MSTHDNAPPVEGWQLPPRCCGDWQTETHCTTCGVLVPANVILGTE